MGSHWPGLTLCSKPPRIHCSAIVCACLLPLLVQVLDAAGVKDPFIRNWLDLLSFLLSGLPADGTIAGAGQLGL